ncbi:MAG: hypothetical protein KC484_00050 [Colwelliaceae bacterium]|jgi:hypothetical protein|nr:hypothetical protein [Colwelliaceae bacterium]
MFTSLFKKQPLVDENTQEWLFDTFSWAIEHFNVQVFLKETQLILPTNEFYSGRVASVNEMANNIFNHTLAYSSMQNWPIRLVNPHEAITTEMPVLTVRNAIRGENALVEVLNDRYKTIDFTFNPSQINQPQDLIASYAQQLATILVMQQKILPPGGKEFLPQAIDVLACVMGFGVIFSNTAYQFKGGCGSCYNPRANRQAALSENDNVYALALFCVLKSKKLKDVKQHLKGHLRKAFGQAYSELSSLSQTSESPLFLTIKK